MVKLNVTKEDVNRSILKSSINTKSYQNGSKIYNTETRDSKFDDIPHAI